MTTPHEAISREDLFKIQLSLYRVEGKVDIILNYFGIQDSLSPTNFTTTHIEGHPVVETAITDEMVNVAETLADLIRTSARGKGLKERFPGSIERERSGLLGHFITALYFYRSWKTAFCFFSIGQGDQVDLKFHGWSFDIKTATQDFHRFLLVPMGQFRDRQFDYYIGVQLRDGRALLWGFASKEQVAAAEKLSFDGNLSYGVPLRVLRPINEVWRLREKDNE